jgi:NAD(P) transhydrogenase subunit alpha
MSNIALLTVFVLAVFVGFEVVSKVSTTLHTPLMSGANAIHGVILVGAILVTGSADDALATTVGLIAIVLATINMVGGFVVTDRMLEMFRSRRPRSPAADHAAPGPERTGDRTDRSTDTGDATGRSTDTGDATGRDA